jgi:hypothetical protein
MKQSTRKYDSIKKNFLKELGSNWEVCFGLPNEKGIVHFALSTPAFPDYAIMSYDIHGDSYGAKCGVIEVFRVQKKQTVSAILRHFKTQEAAGISPDRIEPYKKKVEKTEYCFVDGHISDLQAVNSILQNQDGGIQVLSGNSICDDRIAALILARDYLYNCLRPRLRDMPSAVMDFCARLSDWLKTGYVPTGSQMESVKKIFDTFHNAAEETSTIDQWSFAASRL